MKNLKLGNIMLVILVVGILSSSHSNLYSIDPQSEATYSVAPRIILPELVDG